MEDKRKYNAQRSSELQKAHLTGEFVAVTKSGGHALFHLGLYACDCGWGSEMKFEF